MRQLIEMFCLGFKTVFEASILLLGIFTALALIYGVFLFIQQVCGPTR